MGDQRRKSDTDLGLFFELLCELHIRCVIRVSCINFAVPLSFLILRTTLNQNGGF